MPMSKIASWRHGYCESGFDDKRVHADTIDFWRFAIKFESFRKRLSGKVSL